MEMNNNNIMEDVSFITKVIMSDYDEALAKLSDDSVSLKNE